MEDPTCRTHRPSPPGTSAEDSPLLVIDGGDRMCAELILELRRHADRAQPGTVIHLIAIDPAAPLDLAAWCHLTGHAYLGPLSPPAAGRPTYAVRVSATARSTRPGSPWRIHTPTGTADRHLDAASPPDTGGSL